MLKNGWSGCQRTHRSVLLEAKDQERNIARRYEIYQSMDLFGVPTVDVSWGRIGTKGQHHRLSFPDPRAASQFVNRLLRRRGSAHKRIGVSYREVTETR